MVAKVTGLQKEPLEESRSQLEPVQWSEVRCDSDGQTVSVSASQAERARVPLCQSEPGHCMITSCNAVSGYWLGIPVTMPTSTSTTLRRLATAMGILGASLSEKSNLCFEDAAGMLVH